MCLQYYLPLNILDQNAKKKKNGQEGVHSEALLRSVIFPHLQGSILRNQILDSNSLAQSDDLNW